MNRCSLALTLPILALSLLAFPAGAQNVCVEFMENHSQDQAWEKACLDFLGSLSSQTPAPSPIAFSQQGSQSQQSLESECDGELGEYSFCDGPTNVSETDCDGMPKFSATDENEIFIAIDPNDHMIQFAISNHEIANGLFAAYSTDGGSCWNSSIIADGMSPAPLGLGGADAWAVFDDSGHMDEMDYIPGHLYISYLDVSVPNTRLVRIAKSINGGVDFVSVDTLGDVVADRPTMAMGLGDGNSAVASLWVTYKQEGPIHTIVVQKAAIDSSGNLINDYCAVGNGLFCDAAPIATDTMPGVLPNVATGHVAVGPGGEVLALWLEENGAPGVSTIHFALDDDGLGPNPFAPVGPAIPTNVGFLDVIPPRGSFRGISPVPTLAWDLSTARHGVQGRVHLVYTDEVVNELHDTDIVWTYSDDAGSTWNMPCPDAALNCMDRLPGPDPIRVNDDPVSPISSQFLPAIAVDQTTGDVAVVWHDPRDDDDVLPEFPNDETHLYFAALFDGDMEFQPNLRISSGLSKATSSVNSQAEYLGIAFAPGREFSPASAYPIWVDNSPTQVSMDPFTARVLPEPSVGTQMLAGVIALMGLSALRSRTRVR